MPTSLQGIAEKAKSDRRHRFRNLFGMLTTEFIAGCWRWLNKRAATGVDRVSAKEYGRSLWENVSALVERMKGGGYRAKLVRRQYIPKGQGKLRPLGIPATEDKLLQRAAAQILEAIYEQDFLPCSFGYRPKRGARDAVKELTRNLQQGRYRAIVEADIKGFFDNLDHQQLIGMLKQRIDDQPFLRLIGKWLRAGVLDTDGKVIHPLSGTPQGGIISPILANIYLHYALDEWFEETVKKHCRGEALLCRYADDFVCAFEHGADAERFYKVLGPRLDKFGLQVAAEKTKILGFDRSKPEGAESFDFLGFEFRWGVDRRGRPQVQRRTARKKLRKSLEAFTEWIRETRSLKLRELMKTLNMKLVGYYNYYGVRGNFKSLYQFYWGVEKLLFKWLNRRSQRQGFNQEAFTGLLERYRLARPRITEKSVGYAAVF